MILKLEYEHPYAKRKRYNLTVLDAADDSVVFSAQDVAEPQLTIMGAFFTALHELQAKENQ